MLEKSRPEKGKKFVFLFSQSILDELMLSLWDNFEVTVFEAFLGLFELDSIVVV